MTAVIQAVLVMLEQLIPAIASASSATTINSIIEALIKMMPFIVEEIGSLIQPVKNIIAALSANPATLPDQLSTLQELDKQVDDAFEAAAKDTDEGK